jgi:TonB family protein
MRPHLFAALFLISMQPLMGQNAQDSKPILAKDPRAVFAAAAPFYDFSDPALKPWHLKASYQLYDEKGNPSEQGTFEYLWASPKVYRSSWTRPGASRTDWYTANGQHVSETTGERIKYFEYRLQAALISPLPDSGDLAPEKFRLERELKSLGKEKTPCIMVVPIMPQHGRIQTVPMGLFPTYCFDPALPVLRVNSSFGTITTAFDHIVKFQNKYLSEEIAFYEGTRKILTAKVDAITTLNPANPALMPPPTATNAKILKVDRLPIDSSIANTYLVRKQVPIYPQDAKDARASGTVVLRAIIGTDGGVHDLHVDSTPWPSLASSALWAVSQWEYKPFIHNGDPVEVETTINVIYTLGN